MELSGPQQENLSSGFLTMQDSKQPTHLQRLARMLEFLVQQVYNYTFLKANKKGADQTARMCRLVCAFDVRMQLRRVFSRQGP